MKVLALIAGSVVALFVLFIVIGVVTGPKTTVELAEWEKQQCIRNKGYGHWRGSSGVSLETFCGGVGAMMGIQKACEIDPAKC